MTDGIRTLPRPAPRDHIYTNSILMAQLSARFPLQQSHYRATVMPQTLLDIWQPRTLQRLWQKSRRSHVISVDLSKQSAFLCHGSEARTLRAHTQCLTCDCSACALPRAIPPVRFSFLCLPVRLSSCIFFIPFTLLFWILAPLPFSFIRSTGCSHWAYIPSPVSLRAGVGGKSGLVVFMQLSLLPG